MYVFYTTLGVLEEELKHQTLSMKHKSMMRLRRASVALLTGLWAASTAIATPDLRTAFLSDAGSRWKLSVAAAGAGPVASRTPARASYASTFSSFLRADVRSLQLQDQVSPGTASSGRIGVTAYGGRPIHPSQPLPLLKSITSS